MTVNCSRFVGRFALLALLLACGGEGAVAPAPVATTLRLSSAEISFDAIGAVQQVTGIVSDQFGQTLAAAGVAWSVSDEKVATVSSNGTLTAVGVGTAQLVARSGSATATATVSVRQVPAIIQVSPSTVTFTSFADTLRLSARVLDSRGNAIAQPTVVWSTSDTTVTLSASGLVTSRANGSATVRATSSGATATASVSVRQVPATIQISPSTVTFTSFADTLRLSARVLDARGNALVQPTVAWSTTGIAVSVSGNGLLNSRFDGTATIVATSGAASASATATVRQQVARVVISPEIIRLTSVGGFAYLSASVSDALGNAMFRTVTWRSTNPSVASVTSSGFVTSVGVGSANIVASADNVSRAASIEVSQVPASLRIVNSFVSLRIGQTVQLVAEVSDASLSVIPNASVTWTALTPSILEVSASGVVTARAGGSGQVRAQIGGVTQIASVFVSP
jgi:hypothetical protein